MQKRRIHTENRTYFELINNNNAAWPELLAMLSDGRASMTTELIRTMEREGNFLWPDKTLLANSITYDSASAAFYALENDDVDLLMIPQLARLLRKVLASSVIQRGGKLSRKNL